MTASTSQTDGPCRYTSRVTLPLYLSPSYLAQPMEGVREQLNRSMLKYVEQLGGVLLTYSDLRLQQPLGRIAFDAPEIHIRVQFKATYFAPKVGDIIDGTVSRIGGDHIAILVSGVFNASIALPSGWDPSRPSVKPDDVARFVVRSVHQANGLLTMHGELASGGGHDVASSNKRKRKKDDKDESKRKHGNEGNTVTAEATASISAGSQGQSGGGKSKRSKEEKEAKRKRKAEKAAARDVE
jgi:hypothetical protein